MGEAELAWSHSNRGSNKDSSAVHNCPDTARGHAARECELEFVLRVSACSNSLNSLDGNERGNHEDKLEEAGAVVVVVVVVVAVAVVVDPSNTKENIQDSSFVDSKMRIQ